MRLYSDEQIKETIEALKSSHNCITCKQGARSLELLYEIVKEHEAEKALVLFIAELESA